MNKIYLTNVGWPFDPNPSFGIEFQRNIATIKQALQKAEASITSLQKRMLIHHHSAPDRTISIWELAALAGFKGRASRMEEYQTLSKLLDFAFEETDVLATGKLPCLAWENKRSVDAGGHRLWTLYEEVAQALEELGWVKVVGNIPQTDAFIPHGSERPKEIISQVTQRERDPLVRDWVLKAAGGICECCKQKAPFKMSDGSPYLEVHHVRHLANGGTDTTQNAVALCPNCHREIHHGEAKENLVENLYVCLSRLRRE